MQPVSLKTIFARLFEGLDQRDRGQGYVCSGLAPTAFGVGSLRVDIASGTYVDSSGAPKLQVAGNVTPLPPAATKTRVDLIYVPIGGGIGRDLGAEVVETITNPALPPAIPAGATPIALVKLTPTAIDYTNITLAYIHDIRPHRYVLDQPNLIPNSDFARHTVFGLAMPEVLADLNGTTKIDGGAAGAVAANIFTQGAANNEYAWCAGSFVWREGRASATFKATAIGGKYQLKFRVDATHFFTAKQNAGGFGISEAQAGVDTDLTSAGNILTINRWYWEEINFQGLTAIAKIYDTGGTVPGVTKASSTLLATSTATIQAGNTAGCHVSITSDQAAAQWGGIATTPGGVYVETWLPESWTVNFGGILGGQAVGYDEVADAGPLGKQWAIAGYIPHASRQLLGQTPVLGHAVIAPSVPYASSFYLKTSGKVGAGSIVYSELYDTDSAGGNLHVLYAVNDASEVAWIRKAGATVSASTGRRLFYDFYFNVGLDTTGRGWVQLFQVEQGSAATPWRPAPEDAGAWLQEVGRIGVDITTTSVAYVDMDPRDLAMNLFLAKDSTVLATFRGVWYNSGAANSNAVKITVDGTAPEEIAHVFSVGNQSVEVSFTIMSRLAAGKHRLAVQWLVSAGTGTVQTGGYRASLRALVMSGK